MFETNDLIPAQDFHASMSVSVDGRPTGELDYDSEPYRMLITKIFHQAKIDLYSQSEEVRDDAIAFLGSDTARGYARMIGFPPCFPNQVLSLHARPGDQARLDGAVQQYSLFTSMC